MTHAAEFLNARDFLLAHRTDYETAYRGFRWPRPAEFNWALDYFDPYARSNEKTALRLANEAGEDLRLTFSELSHRSGRVANFLRECGVEGGHRVLLMLDNVVPLWEVLLACMKLRAVVVPATTQLTSEDLVDRIERGRVDHVITGRGQAEKFSRVAGDYSRICVAGAPVGWTSLDAAADFPTEFAPDRPTGAADPLLLYFTSGTTARPKLVRHTHLSYPAGHLSTMYWIGLEEGDVHWNISSPGWAKHAWSSVFAPWNAGATVFVLQYERFDAATALRAMVDHGVTTLCAPPTVWRLLIQEDLTVYDVKLRELVAAGEPLNPEIIARVKEAWGLTIRDGYGQTETTAQIGNPPGQPVKPGSMGRPLPGYSVALLDPGGDEAEEGEMCLRLEPRPVGLMTGYDDDLEPDDEVMRGGYYHTRDVAARDEDGYFWYVGRRDDVFKSSDYRISPFELESALLEHAAVAEAAVVPSPDPIRLSVPKAFVGLTKEFEADAAVARDILAFSRARLTPYKRIRRVEFRDLPKTVSGKIRRVELRRLEEEREQGSRRALEFWEEDFPDL